MLSHIFIIIYILSAFEIYKIIALFYYYMIHLKIIIVTINKFLWEGKDESLPKVFTRMLMLVRNNIFRLLFGFFMNQAILFTQPQLSFCKNEKLSSLTQLQDEPFKFICHRII